MPSSDSDRELILVDGRSGAGKTSWAAQLQATRGGLLISLDDHYPGWDGLDAGSAEVFRSAITPWLRGETGQIRRWDWAQGDYLDTIGIEPSRILIVEGCGAISRDAAQWATSSFWIEAPEQVRKSRALARDGSAFAPHWDRWRVQEDRFIALHRSPELALVTVST
jgi:uridine kinase